MRTEAIIFFNGPLSLWLRSGKQAMCSEIQDIPEPDSREVIIRKSFKYQWMAQVWATARMKGTENLSLEIRKK